MKKTLLFACVCISLYYLGSWFCTPKTDAFTLGRIHSALTHHHAWETPLPIGEEKHTLATLLSQPFHYLGSGGQCYAFVSEDGNYVIKFFKHKLRAPWNYFYTHPLPAPLEAVRLRKLAKILMKLDRDFTSYKLAYEELQPETGILYVHLNKTTGLNQAVTIYDKLNIAHTIDLDQIEFIVQKKADLAYSYLDSLIQNGNLTQLKVSIDSLIEVIISRCKKGIFDEDAKIHRNFGFIDGKAVVIDVGRFRKDPSRTSSDVYTQDVRTITRSLRVWMQESCPELTPWLEQRLAADL
jgi:hypothetical protein